MTAGIHNPHLAERLRRMDEEAAIKRVRRAVAKPTAIDMKRALLCGSSLGRKPRSVFVTNR